MIEIRPIHNDDHSAVLDLWSKVLAYDAPHNEPQASLKRKLDMDDGLLLVAHDGNQLVGTVMGGYDGHRGWIYSLAVSPSYRHRGIGTLLMEKIEAILIERGCPKINLQVIADNAEVVAFYQHLGYKVEPRVNLGKIITAGR